MSDEQRLKVVKIKGKMALQPGVEFKVKGQRGARFVFKYGRIEKTGSTCVTCWGGPKGRGAWRSFDVSQVSTVHRKAKQRPATITGKRKR